MRRMCFYRGNQDSPLITEGGWILCGWHPDSQVSEWREPEKGFPPAERAETQSQCDLVLGRKPMDEYVLSRVTNRTVDKIGLLQHRSDSNISSDFIAIFLSLISSFCGQHLKI